MITRITAPGWSGNLVALILGLSGVFSFAPFNVWLLPFIIFPLAIVLVINLAPKAALFRSYCFALGFFATGLSWIHVSIHEFGNASMALAIALTGLLVAFMALFPALAMYVGQKLAITLRFEKTIGYFCILIPLSLTLGELARSTVFTGFPWLLLGYSQFDTPLIHFASVLGVYGLSYLVYIIIGATAFMLFRQKFDWLAGGLISVIMMVGIGLSQIEWVKPTGKTLSIGLVQANIPQDRKWLPEERLPTIQKYHTLTQEVSGADLVVWPEAALPVVQNSVKDYLSRLRNQLQNMGSSLVLGIPSVEFEGDRRLFFNRALLLSETESYYNKQHLVPFGEYVPLEDWLRGLIDFFDLPMSRFSEGSHDQPNLMMGDIALAPAICYEVAYSNLVRDIALQSGSTADILITLSNDAWFGDSVGPLQHFEIARMRAVELGRPLIRGTNTGLTGLVNFRGETTHVLPQFTADTLVGDIELVKGETPFAYWGFYINYLLLLLNIGYLLWRFRKR
ncbi:MAG: apolipoprotein N-acyltransferase [Pseudomonadota bacterium]